MSWRTGHGYKNDWIGLKTLHETGRLDRLAFDGEHVAVPPAFWEGGILPLLGEVQAPVCPPQSPFAPPPQTPLPSLPPPPALPLPSPLPVPPSDAGEMIQSVLGTAAAFIAGSPSSVWAGCGLLVGVALGCLCSLSYQRWRNAIGQLCVPMRGDVKEDETLLNL